MTSNIFLMRVSPRVKVAKIGPLQDPVTWYGINYTGTQMTQWDFQNKRKSGWTGKNSFVLEVPLHHLRPSVIYSVPWDRILQRAYFVACELCYKLFVWSKMTPSPITHLVVVNVSEVLQTVGKEFVIMKCTRRVCILGQLVLRAFYCWAC